jgi:hypothetical protein
VTGLRCGFCRARFYNGAVVTVVDLYGWHRLLTVCPLCADVARGVQGARKARKRRSIHVRIGRG